jgi:uncharacterized protein YwgA
MGNLELLASIDKRVLGRDKIRLDTIGERIIIQKLVLICQKMGFNIGDYDYGWYVHGPYSTGLTVDAYKLSVSGKDFATYKFAPEEHEKIERITQAFRQEIKEMDSVKFELYGSIAFCIHNGLKDNEEIRKEVERRKPWYPQAQIDEGIRKTKRLFAS